jgi:hypothetical protein
MKKPRKMTLCRETLRDMLQGPQGENGPFGTETASITPQQCHTASCRPAIC